MNIVATYGRSLFSLVCGIFTGRWLLMALGEVDYGLFGVVGGLAGFISVINSILSGSVERFYAFSIGKASVDRAHGLRECQKWFTTACLVHTVLPTIFMVIGYPIGEWAVRHFLTIPEARIVPCVWVFRFVCISTFVAMFSASFNAMYTAKQYIAELTLYSFAQTAINVCFMYFMVTHPGDWLAKYGLYTCLLSVVPQIIISIRAIAVFPECRVIRKELFNTERLKVLSKFSGWQAFGGLSGIVRGQCMAILINKYFGARINAAMGVAGTVNQHASSLSMAMQGAFVPVITTACGAGRYDEMRDYAFRACKFGMLLVLLFALPLAMELRGVMTLWLKDPPDYSVGLCGCMMIGLVIDKSSLGHMVAVNATGKIALYQAVLGGALLLSFPIAWMLLAMGCGPYAVGFAVVVTQVICAWGRVGFARSIVQMSIRHWLMGILLPVFVSVVVTCAVGYIPHLYMTPGFVRICVTSIVCELVFLPMVWFVVLDRSEREFVQGRIVARIKRR